MLSFSVESIFLGVLERDERNRSVKIIYYYCNLLHAVHTTEMLCWVLVLVLLLPIWVILEQSFASPNAVLSPL